MYYLRTLSNMDRMALYRMVKSHLEEDMVVNDGASKAVFTVSYPESKMKDAIVYFMDDKIEVDLNKYFSFTIDDFGAELEVISINPTNVRISSRFQHDFVAFMMERFSDYADEYRRFAMRKSQSKNSQKLINALNEVQAEIDAKKSLNL